MVMQHAHVLDANFSLMAKVAFNLMLMILARVRYSQVGLFGAGFVRLVGCHIKNNGRRTETLAAASTGAIDVGYGCKATLQQCIIANNTANNGAGLLSSHGSVVLIVDTNIANNTALTTGGGALFHGTVNVTGSWILNNAAGSTAGGLFFATGSKAMLDGANIQANTAECGAGFYADDQSRMQLRDTNVHHNIALQTGGGMYFYRSSVTMINTTVGGNRARSGGGVYSNMSDLVLQSNSFIANAAHDGAAVAWYDSKRAQCNNTVLVANTFLNNLAVSGGACVYELGPASLGDLWNESNLNVCPVPSNKAGYGAQSASYPVRVYTSFNGTGMWSSGSVEMAQAVLRCSLRDRFDQTVQTNTSLVLPNVPTPVCCAGVQQGSNPACTGLYKRQQEVRQN